MEDIHHVPGWAVPGGHGPMTLGGGISAAAAAANAAWLEDCIVHLLCVLALDRFGDFGSDQVPFSLQGSRLPHCPVVF